MGFFDSIALGDYVGYRIVAREEGADMQIVLRAVPVNPYRNPAIAATVTAGRRFDSGFPDRLEEAKRALVAAIDHVERKLSLAIAR